MPKGHERPQPSHTPGYARIRRLADQLADGGGPGPMRARRPVAVAQPWGDGATPRLLLIALGGAGLLMLLGWMWLGAGLHPFCRFR